jgi:hypothetical protein
MKRIARLLAFLVVPTCSICCGGKPGEPKQDSTPGARPVENAKEEPKDARPEMTFLICQFPSDEQPLNRGEAVRVRLDAVRTRAHDLSVDDVKRAFAPSRMVVSPEPTPPPGVVFVPHVGRPDQYESIIVKATAEGQIVRLRDVAVVERTVSE